MNSFKKSMILGAAAGLTSGLALAGEATGSLTTPTTSDYDAHRVDAHAPIGVMGDHTHEVGEWMLSYRYMFMSMDGQRAGTNSLSSQQVFGRGYMMAATEMDMEMHMFGLMYAPSERLTLMAMANYVRKDMTMEMMSGMEHSHSSEGLGDVTVGALLSVYDRGAHRVHLNLGLVLPTAEVDVKDSGVYQPYGMQLGSGTWDAQFGVTYTGQSENWSWGAQLLGRVGLEDENESGFSYGDSLTATTWLARKLTDSVSLSARLAYVTQDRVDGHYDGPHSHHAPSHFQENYGGDVLEAGLGVNFLFQNGVLKGHRLAAEVLVPIYQDANGVGMDRDYTFTLGWQKAF
ncbi:transporter [Verrucomicrobiaceae bacterium 5K15]|uniref:Transporter n=1 Tax=Oceaniferula flava TaxID=2800421 RepID=A0AAE2SEK8_9BACT|nr:transporter [Oceaniferula flavus]MBK1855952.1 transporter [Oceaniferula flavus]MBM1137259.1 transporter [Oceaniferula flavus]